MDLSEPLNWLISGIGALFSGLEFILQSGLNTFNGLTGMGKVFFGIFTIAGILIGVTWIKGKFDKLPNE